MKFAFHSEKTYGWDTMVGGPYEAKNTLDHSRLESEGATINPRLAKVHPGHVREYGGKDTYGHTLYETEAQNEAHAMMKMIPVLKKRGHLD